MSNEASEVRGQITPPWGVECNQPVFATGAGGRKVLAMTRFEAGLSKIDHASLAARLKPCPPKTASQNLPNSDFGRESDARIPGVAKIRGLGIESRDKAFERVSNHQPVYKFDVLVTKLARHA